MKKHPSSWSIVFAAPQTDARIFRKSQRKAAPWHPLAGAEEREVDALLGALDEMPPPSSGRRLRVAETEHDPELYVATVPLPFRPRGAHPPAPRHEVLLAKVLVDDALLVPPPRPRKSRELETTRVSLRRTREVLEELPTARPLSLPVAPRPGPLAFLGYAALAFLLGGFAVAVVSCAGRL